MSKFRTYLPTIIYVLASVLVEAFGVLLGNQISFWVVLLFIVGLATWNLGVRPGALMAALTSAMIGANEFVLQSHYSSNTFALFATLSKVIVIFACVALVGALRQREVERVHVKKVR